MPPNWDRLIRFIATDDRELRGQPILPSPDFDVGTTTKETKLKANVISVKNNDIFDPATAVTDEVVTVKKLLGPVTQQEVPIIRCIGLNFIKHSTYLPPSHLPPKQPPKLTPTTVQEGGRTLPPYPPPFIKANTSLSDHASPIIIPKIAQDNQADYEGELCFIISRDAKDVLASSARSYIGAYLAGNDVSSRKLQRDPLLAGTVPQWNFSKGFDTFAPLGPQLVNSAVVGDVNRLELRTTVNGEVRQQSGIEDLLFKVEELVSYFSQGTTLKKGTVFMTGTCAGVGYAMAEPQFLKPGDVVEVRIWPEVGTLRNWVEFA
ncbi:fumarylacetoacetate hydrolase family protein [Pyrenophora tritici-repentis]|nr:fumarylacetoacetate hydrolase family protein [Pyrenophora tritici-repentis]